MAELTKNKPAPSAFQPTKRTDDNADVVRGGYQPVGKVDIAAIRAQAKKGRDDDRPTIVKGAYEPVGKVDIAAIRAKARDPSKDSGAAPSATSTAASTSDEPKPVSDRASAFSQPERLTSLPKPKVANKFGSNTSNFTGTKAPTPGAFGLQSAPSTASPAPVGAASRTFADEGGKTPAQIWAEKKARERGLSGAADTKPSITSPITSQTSGGGEWKSGYAGKSWAPVATTATGRSGTGSIGQQKTGEEEPEQEEAPVSSSGGIGALKDRFAGGIPLGVPGDSAPLPPVPQSSRPEQSPGLPTRPRPDEEEEEEYEAPSMPPPPQVPRALTPPTPEEREEREESPVRLAIPVARSKEPEMEAPEERHVPPTLPTQSIERNIPEEEDLTEEPTGHDPARGAGAAVAEATFGASAEPAHQGSGAGGKRALILYDYEKAEDNEVDLIDGEYITNIEMVDDDWWAGTNSKGESGLFPSNYVQLVEEEEDEASEAPPPMAPRPGAPAPAPAPAATSAGPTANAIYDYEAAEDNELSFPEGAVITDLVRACPNTS
jgi:hypothetical protein